MGTVVIDMGGTAIKAGIVTDNKVLNPVSIPSFSERDFGTTISRIDSMVRELVATSGFSLGKISGIGLAVPGIVDVDSNRVLAINEKHNGAIVFDFPSWASDRYGIPLVMENDARAALMGEWQFGAGKGYNHIVMVTLGTGVGGATLIDGKLLYGKHYQAGCLGGHFTVNYDGRRCTCGNLGCVEAEASSWNLMKLLREHPDFKEQSGTVEEGIDFEQLFIRYTKNDEVAKDIIGHCLKVWASGIVSLIHAYDPEMVILSGGIMKSGGIILPFIRDWVERYAWTPSEKVRVEAASQTENAALLGLSYLSGEKLNTPKFPGDV